MKNVELQALSSYLQSNIAQKDLPVRGAVKVAKNIRKIETELKEWNEKKTQIFKEYGKEENGMIQIKFDELDKEVAYKVQKDLADLNDMDTDIEFDKLTIDDMPSTMSAQELLMLNDIVEI